MARESPPSNFTPGRSLIFPDSATVWKIGRFSLAACVALKPRDPPLYQVAISSRFESVELPAPSMLRDENQCTGVPGVAMTPLPPNLNW